MVCGALTSVASISLIVFAVSFDGGSVISSFSHFLAWSRGSGSIAIEIGLLFAMALTNLNSAYQVQEDSRSQRFSACMLQHSIRLRA